MHNTIETKPGKSVTRQLIHKTDFESCIRCGLCLSVCPTYREFKTETASPRGRVFLAEKGLAGDLDLTPNLYKQMYACFDCLACREVCPLEVDPARVSVNMRAEQEQKRPSRWKIPVFDKTLSQPKTLERVTVPLRIYQKSGFRWLVYKLGLIKWLPEKLKDWESMLPHLTHKPLRTTIPREMQAQGPEKDRVGFFLGCAQNLFFPHVSKAAIRVLNKNGCTVITPAETQCCGMPMRSYGKRESAEKMAMHNIEVFEQLDISVIVTDCATCGSQLKDYPDLLRNCPGWKDRALNFSQKVRDISEFLTEIPITIPRGVLSEQVTYHDPCHLRRGQNVWQQPRELLQSINGLKLTELKESDWCCGSAGSQLISHHRTSINVLQRKMDHLKETNADIIASGCPGCMMQLQVGIRRENLKVKVMHPIELLDRAYASEPLVNTKK